MGILERSNILKKDVIDLLPLYRKNYSVLKRYGLSLLNDKFIVDTIVQEAFLKLWDYRATIGSVDHALAFLKMNIKWECYAYFRSPAGRFQRNLTYLDAIENSDSLFGIHNSEAEEDRDDMTDRRLKAINDMIPFLINGRERDVLKLYYSDGFNCKQIAQRYGITVSKAALDLRSGIAKLRAMVASPQQVFAKSNIACEVSAAKRVWLYDIEGLNKEQSKIYRLRIECKYSFQLIARSLNLPQAYVQKEYVKAWKAVSLQKKKKGSGFYPKVQQPEPANFLTA